MARCYSTFGGTLDVVSFQSLHDHSHMFKTRTACVNLVDVAHLVPLALRDLLARCKRVLC